MLRNLHIALIEPFYTGSHKQWADELKRYSSHSIQLFSLPGHHWKWRMHGAAVTLAYEILQSDFKPDLILATDMLDLTTFLALIRSKFPSVPAAIYFHENQISYPWSPDDADPKLGRDNHYGFMNYSSALAADRVFFNSNYHKNSFLDGLPAFLSQFPDYNNLNTIDRIRNKSEVLHLGLDLQKFDPFKTDVENKIPLILWNHRWEYDKNPESFFGLLSELKNDGFAFQLCVLGQQLPKSPAVFKQANETFKNEIVHWGYAGSFETYATWLWKSDILLCTSYQDFFGISVIEGLYCGCYPVLPDRLVYPEHVPGAFLYDSNPKALQLIKQSKTLPGTFQKKFLEQYDWEAVIDHYDEVLRSVVA